jgi:hypothetical protein
MAYIHTLVHAPITRTRKNADLTFLGVRRWNVELEHAPDLMILLAAFVDRVAGVGAKLRDTKVKGSSLALRSVVVDSDDKPLRVNETAKPKPSCSKWSHGAVVNRKSRKYYYDKIHDTLLGGEEDNRA